jgi:hypothetical protein
VFGWYDNEWGYACRLADLAALAGGMADGPGQYVTSGTGRGPATVPR